MDELISLKAVREFYAQLQGPEGARSRSTAPTTCSTGQASEVGDALRRSACGFLMHDAVIVSAAPHRRRQGAERRRSRPSRRRDGGTVIAEALRRRPASIRARSTT
jgi:hypothetical protein